MSPSQEVRLLLRGIATLQNQVNCCKDQAELLDLWDRLNNLKNCLVAFCGNQLISGLFDERGNNGKAERVRANRTNDVNLGDRYGSAVGVVRSRKS